MMIMVVILLHYKRGEKGKGSTPNFLIPLVYRN